MHADSLLLDKDLERDALNYSQVTSGEENGNREVRENVPILPYSFLYYLFMMDQ